MVCDFVVCFWAGVSKRGGLCAVGAYLAYSGFDCAQSVVMGMVMVGNDGMPSRCEVGSLSSSELAVDSSI